MVFARVILEAAWGKVWHGRGQGGAVPMKAPILFHSGEHWPHFRWTFMIPELNADVKQPQCENWDPSSLYS